MTNHHQTRIFAQVRQNLAILMAALLLPLLLLGAIGGWLWHVEQAEAAGALDVQIIAGYNLVVDSNVLSPSTYAPQVATVLGRVCNTGDATLNGVQAYIGDGTTPGSYPQRAKAAIQAEHPDLYAATADGTAYYFEHIGRLTDASRFVGALGPGQCANQYWMFTYPRRANLAADNDNLGSVPTWGDSVKAYDDLWLDLVVWANDDVSSTSDSQTWRMTMRNEISAAANKIQPNPDGRWFNTVSDTVKVGDVITSNGILYRPGNVNQGFDNDNDGLPDYNAWFQPIGDPAFDPSCFRLVRTSGVLTITRSAGLPDLYVHFDDQTRDPLYGGPTYFTNLPSTNTGVVGNIYYTFLALGGPCTTALTPYQEVASGFDNEKFNGDYGTGIPPIASPPPDVTLTKSSSPANVGPSLPATLNYSIPFNNTGSSAAGLSLASGGVYVPVVISDTIPTGLVYNGDADTGNTDPASCSNCYTLRYSTDSGATWTTTEPAVGTASTAPNNLIKIQWWLNEPLAPGEGGIATFSADVPANYITSGNNPLVENCADASLAAGTPFAEACDTSFVLGDNHVGDTVWLDDGGTTGTANNGIQDGNESGIGAVTVWLYWDSDSNGQLDTTIDSLLVTTPTLSAVTNGHPIGWYAFSRLPDGHYLVQVDEGDGDIPIGHRLTTAGIFPVTGLGTATTSPYLDADFGFGPSLTLLKRLTSSTDPIYEGDLITFTIDVMNNRPGNGGNPGDVCLYNTWANTTSSVYNGTGNKAWLNPTNIHGAPDATHAVAPFANAGESIGPTGWSAGINIGTPTSVHVRIPYVTNPAGFGANDRLDVLLIDCGLDGCSGLSGGGANDVQIGITRQFFPRNMAASGTIDIDVTNDRAWAWSDFNGGRIVIQLVAQKQGNPTSTFSVDAAGFQIGNGLTCNDPADVMNPVPLTDTFDPAKLQFVSATPPETSVNVSTIDWNNVGPINPGQTRQVQVTFRVVASSATTHQNCADSPGGVFSDGLPTNDPAQSCVTNNITPTGSLGDRVWSDANNNGVQDAGEPGIPNVTLHLCGPAATPSNPCTTASPGYRRSTTTDANGNYLFTALRDGNYRVSIQTNTVPGFGVSTTQSGDPDVASPPACAGAACDNTGLRTISGANDVLTMDFGYRLTLGAIYGTVWNDLDVGGDKDASEGRLSGVQVRLCGALPCDGTVPANIIATTNTDANGNYFFGNVAVGVARYTAVNVTTLPAGTTWAQSGDPDVSPPACSGAVCNNQWNTGVSLVAGQIYGSVDFGYHGNYSIGDRVWTDWNGNGIQEATEEGINGVNVELYRITNCGSGTCNDGDETLSTSPIATQITATNGNYLFANLNNGNYRVIVKSGMRTSHAQTGDPDQPGVTCTICDGQATITNLNSNLTTIDFGYKPLGVGRIGDRVWIDGDADGIQDVEETGLGNITVYLYYDANNNGTYDAAVDAPIASTFTADGSGVNPAGHYQFTGLYAPAGGENYLVLVDTADPDIPSRGGVPYALSTANPQAVTLTSVAPSIQTADFGFYPKGVIGDTIWRDDNGDGQQGATESGIGGVEVDLYLCSTVDADSDGEYCDDGTTYVTSATTDASGFYQFTGLEAGHYQVQVNPSTLPAGGTGWVQTGDPDAWLDAPPCGAATGGPGCNNTSTEIVIFNGQVDLGHDFGYQPAVYFGDTVWINPNGDGVQDSAEPGIPGVMIELYANATCTGTPVATTETDENGRYGFGGYLGSAIFPSAGTYCVLVDTADPDFPANLAQNWDADAAADHQTTVVIDAGGTITAVGDNTTCPACRLAADFGYRYDGNNSISGTVFYDAGNDGGNYSSGTDSPYPGITVSLINCGSDATCGTGDDFPVASTITAANGLFNFTNLPNGTYRIAVDGNDDDLRGLDQTREPDQDPCSGNPANCNNSSQVTMSGGTSSAGNDYGYYGQLDCGDLPNNTPPFYATEKVDNGACHLLGTGLRLGSQIDADADGQPDAQAGNYNSTGGDDNDGTDDEDGVTRGMGSWAPGADVTINTTINLGTSTLAYVAAWVDWDGNGQFDQPNEKVILGTVAASGTPAWAITVPDNYNAGDPLFVRVRVYDATGGIPTSVSPTGIVRYGEVEDYLWRFTPTAISLGHASAAGAGTGLATVLFVSLVCLGLTSLYVLKRRERPA